MVVDYERAWTELQAHVAGKSQHGREGLLTRMAEVAAECRVPPGELASLLRLYGVEVERARAIAADHSPDGHVAFGGGLASIPDIAAADRHRTEEVHDEHDRSAGSRAA